MQISQLKIKNVMELVIEPMMAMYQPPMHLRSDTDKMKLVLDEYQNQLSEFERKTLSDGWADVKKTHSTWLWPQMQVIREACMGNLPVGKPSTPEGDAKLKMPRGNLEDFNPSLAKEILGTTAGKLSLEKGVAMSLMVDYECKGKTDFDEAYVHRQAGFLKQALSDLTAMPDAEPKPALMALYESMNGREKKLYRMFAA